MFLEKNGIMSSSIRTKHIKDRHFMIADKVGKGEVEFAHCGTDSFGLVC